LKLDRDKLQRARELLGYSIETTAEAAGVSKNSVLRAEHEDDIRPVTARKIAGALGVRVAELIGESETLKVQPRLPSFNGETRREAIYGPWLDFVSRYADQWESRLATGDFDLSSLEEFDRVTDDLLDTLSPLGLQEKHEQPVEYPYSFGPIIGEALGRIFDLFNPMLAAAAEKFPREVLGDELEPLRRRREQLRELRRGA
jgi:transcriptional regulator with XRE-family HTH domain